MKKITITFEGWWECVFEVDFAKAAPACLESLNFFGDPITREDESPEETVKAFIKFWFPTIIEESIRLNVNGVRDAVSQQEGCIPLDGSQGIRLVSCDSWGFQGDDLDFETKEAA